MKQTAENYRDRVAGMIWGQFVGDAASLGTHWIYDLAEIKALCPEGVLGFEAPQSGHYHAGKVPGDLTHYGDAALVLLESVAQKGSFDATHFGEQWFARMTPDSGYQGYFDGASKGTLENKASFEARGSGGDFDYQQGADDAQLATISSLAPVVAAHGNATDLFSTVEKATRVRQNNDQAVRYNQLHARLLKELLEGKGVVEALTALHLEVARQTEWPQEFRQGLEQVEELQSGDVIAGTLKLGQSCPLKGSFPAALLVLAQQPKDFALAIRATLSAGGDNAGRAAMLGAWLGARWGVSGVPEQWRTQLTESDRIAEAVARIVESK